MDDLMLICHTYAALLWWTGLQLKSLLRSKLKDLDMQVQGSQNSPTSGVMNAKWYVETSTRVSINLNQKHALKNPCREHMHTWVGNEAASKADMDKTSYTSSIYEFMGLVHRGNNSNKETLIDIP